MAFIIIVLKWLLWTVETMYETEFITFWCKKLVNTPSKHGVDPMLVQYWPTICDACPASNQHWFNASCVLGCGQPSKHKTFVHVVLTLYKCYKGFVFAWNSSWSGIACSLLLATITSQHRPNVC